MKTSTARDLLTLSPAQAAYALALADYEAATISADAAKVAAGIDYTGCETDAAIDAMATREGDIDDAHNIGPLRDALTDAELRLVAWGIEHACGLPGVAAEQAAELRHLGTAAKTRIVVRAKVVAQCVRLGS